MTDTAPVTDQMTDIHDIKPLVEVLLSGSFEGAIWYALGGLLLLGLLAVAWRLWRRRRRPLDIFPAEVLMAPEEAASRALDALAAESAIDAKAFYFRLSEVFRAYLAGRFDIEGLEMTTEELIPAVTRLTIDGTLKSGIRDLLLFSDPVKFADMSAPASCLDRDLEFVRLFVRQTTPDTTRDGATGPNTALTPVTSR